VEYIALISPSRAGHVWVGRMFNTWVNGYEPKIPFYLFENTNLKNWVQTKHEHVLKDGKPDNGIVFLQTRDYLNFAASWFKYLLRKEPDYVYERLIQSLYAWYNITREGLGDTNIIEHKSLLSYDLFVKSRIYRKSICSMAGAHYSEEDIDWMPSKQHSSFDGLEYRGRGSEMKVGERWRWFFTEEGKCFTKHIRQHIKILDYYIENFELSREKTELINEILK